MFKRLRQKRKFTLIELIIVIVVIGILAGMAIPKFIGITRDAKVAAMIRDVETLEKTIAMEQIKNDKIPLFSKENTFFESENLNLTKFVFAEEDYSLNNMSGIYESLKETLVETEDNEEYLYKINIKDIDNLDNLKYGKDKSEGDFYVYSIKSNRVYYYGYLKDSDSNFNHTNVPISLDNNNLVEKLPVKLSLLGLQLNDKSIDMNEIEHNVYKPTSNLKGIITNESTRFIVDDLDVTDDIHLIENENGTFDFSLDFLIDEESNVQIVTPRKTYSYIIKFNTNSELSKEIVYEPIEGKDIITNQITALDKKWTTVPLNEDLSAFEGRILRVTYIPAKSGSYSYGVRFVVRDENQNNLTYLRKFITSQSHRDTTMRIETVTQQQAMPTVERTAIFEFKVPKNAKSILFYDDYSWSETLIVSKVEVVGGIDEVNELQGVTYYLDGNTLNLNYDKNKNPSSLTNIALLQDGEILGFIDVAENKTSIVATINPNAEITLEPLYDGFNNSIYSYKLKL